MTTLAAAPDVLARLDVPLAQARVATVWGGGGLKLAYQVGVWAGLVDAGVRIIESHGVSAGALVTAMLIQGRLDEMVEVARGTETTPPALTSDVHRWKTGPEIVAGLIRGNLGALGRNDRLDSKYLQPFIPDDIGKIDTPKGFVGAVDFETEEYLSIPHTVPEWDRAVYGSATMPPAIWAPIRWHDHQAGRVRYLVDGGTRSAVPVMDVYRRIFAGMLYCDLVIVVPTGMGELSRHHYRQDIQADTLRSVGIMTGQISRDDVEGVDAINNILEQVGDTVPLYSRDGHRYRYVPTIYIRPTRDLGGPLDSSPELQKARFDHGVQRVSEVLGAVAA